MDEMVLLQMVPYKNCVESPRFKALFFKNVIFRNHNAKRKEKKARSAQLKVLPKLI